MGVSTIKGLRKKAAQLLFDEGIDISLVNISVDGVRISSFNKLVDMLYLLGYDDAEAYRPRRKIDAENVGKALTEHAQRARQIASQSKINRV